MKLRNMAARALVASVAVGLLVGGCAGGGTGGREIVVDDPVQLTRTFEDGQTVKYKLSSAGEMAIAMQGYDRVAITQTEFKTTCSFSSADTDEINMAMRFDNAVSSITVGDDVIMAGERQRTQRQDAQRIADTRRTGALVLRYGR